MAAFWQADFKVKGLHRALNDELEYIVQCKIFKILNFKMLIHASNS